MDARILTTKLEGAVERQLLMTGGQSEVEAAVEMLLSVLEPALSAAALDIAEQAAAEIAGQLPDYEIDVVVVDGDPELRVRSVGEDTITIGAGEPLDARITLRLPPNLKDRIESSAGDRGESVNSWLVRALAAVTSSSSRKSGRKVSGRIQT